MNFQFIDIKKAKILSLGFVSFLFFGLAIASLPFFAQTVSAHEVYVLSPERVLELEKLPSVSFIDTILAHTSETLLWGFIVATLIMVVFFVSISAKLENRFDRHLIKLKHFAPFIARITAGLALLFCAYHAALFGPELPFSEMFVGYEMIMQGVFYALGVMILLGLYPRIIGLICLFIFMVGVLHHGTYMFTYANYFGEFVVLLLIGGHRFSVTHEHGLFASFNRFLNYLSTTYGEYAFLFLRICFGFGLIYAAVYAKFLHNQLAIEVVNVYNLQQVFLFSPEFIVLGAGIVEILLGTFFILGIEIRFTAIVLNIFLTLSLIYFGEAVWPHIILIGLPIAFLCYGYDKYSLEGYFFKRGNREPIF